MRFNEICRQIKRNTYINIINLAEVKVPKKYLEYICNYTLKK